MNINKEYEIKLLIPKTQYDKLYALSKEYDGKTVKQINHYFDTKDLFFTENKYALRIREKNGKYEATLKTGGIKREQTLLSKEHNKVLSKAGALAVIDGKISITQVFPEITRTAGVSHNADIIYHGNLVTHRTTYRPIADIHELELDRNQFLEVKDYELEWEFKNRDEYNRMVCWLQSKGIKASDYKTLSKYGRFMKQLHG